MWTNLKEIRTLSDSIPLMGGPMCIRVEGLLVPYASTSSISFIYAEVCQIVHLFNLNTSAPIRGIANFFLELCIAHSNHLVQ